MIVSVSRRTDIPAFYTEWFINRLKEGYILVKNPFNRKQISKVILTKEYVTCFVFWTKNPTPLMKYLDFLKEYMYYFQITITGYEKDIEPTINKKKVIETTIKLSKDIGSSRVIWRYDPIFINEKYSIEYHINKFEELASKLSGFTNKCVISFLDIYKETKRNSELYNLKEVNIEQMHKIALEFSKIAKKYNIQLETCAENIDLAKYSIKKTKCIDDNLISNLVESDIKSCSDNIREGCGCVKAVDIGEYNTCMHKCVYCYANFNKSSIDINFEKHNTNSQMLIGELCGDEKITQHHLCKEKKLYKKSDQLTLF